MIIKQIKYLSWTVLGILLFALSFPGYLNSDGLPFMAFFALYPLFYLISKMNYGETIFYGFIYGAGSYLLFNYWLKTFDPITFSVLPTIIGGYYILLFLLCKYIFFNFKKYTYVPLALAWLLYEVFKGENLIGYTYGTIAHSMYRTHLFTGISDITGTYVVSLLIIFPAAFFAVIFFKGFKNYNKKEILITSVIYLTILISSILYTFLSKVDYSKSETLKTALIQHNIDSWAKGSNEVYKETLDVLIDLSLRAKKEEPELVIWSETAFVPAIEWHKEYKSSRFRLDLVNQLEQFIQDYGSEFVIGANERIGLSEEESIYYNSAYHYPAIGKVDKYRKNILVPFTERFPFPKLLPWLHTYIKSIGGKDLTSGSLVKNFYIRGFQATPLICYEDTFSTNVRKAIKLGGDIIINMTNDAWSSEDACSKQHLSAALFRSIENRRSFVRVGTGGYSCVIDPNGKILASIPILTEGQITYEIPMYNNKISFFTEYGNIIERILILVLICLLLIRPIKSILFALRQEKI